MKLKEAFTPGFRQAMFLRSDLEKLLTNDPIQIKTSIALKVLQLLEEKGEVTLPDGRKFSLALYIEPAEKGKFFFNEKRVAIKPILEKENPPKRK